MRRGGASIGVRIGSFKAPGASGLGSFFLKGLFPSAEHPDLPR